MDNKLLWQGGGMAAGAAIGGPAGAMVGGAVGGMIGGLFEQGEETPPLPPMVDPLQQEMLTELNTRRRAIEMGTSTEFATAQELIQRAEGTALSNIQKYTGGDVGAAVAAAESVMSGTQENIGKLAGQASQMAAPYTQMIGDLVNRMSQRRLELGMADRLQTQAVEAQREEDLNANVSNLISSTTLLSAMGKGVNYGNTLAAKGLGVAGNWLNTVGNEGYDRRVYGNFLADEMLSNNSWITNDQLP